MTATAPAPDAPDINAFVPGPRVTVEATCPGPLSGKDFAVKDLFDIAGQATGAGNPDWARATRPALQTADAVTRLLEAGARCVGKTITDELAFSLEGRNAHFGAPRNPRHPDCLPGGSSSGSASAVAAGHADFALGTDTGGSVRVPAAFCGIWGMRPSHGRISTEGLLPFAPSYDTVGWFARDLDLLCRVGAVLLPDDAEPSRTATFLLAEDALSLVDADVAAAVRDAADTLGARPVRVFPDGWDAVYKAYATLQANDIRASLGPDLQRISPRFGADIGPRFQAALTDHLDVEGMTLLRDRCRSHLRATVPPGCVLVLPSAPVARLPLEVSASTLEDFYPRALALCALAGHAGAPQVHIPHGPIGFSLLAHPGCDRALLEVCERRALSC